MGGGGGGDALRRLARIRTRPHADAAAWRADPAGWRDGAARGAGTSPQVETYRLRMSVLIKELANAPEDMRAFIVRQVRGVVWRELLRRSCRAVCAQQPACVALGRAARGRGSRGCVARTHVETPGVRWTRFGSLA